MGIKLRKLTKQTWIQRSLSVTLALGIALVISQFSMEYFEAFFYDLRFQLKPTSPVSGKVITLAIDSKTVREMGGEPDAMAHREVLEKLAPGKPQSVVYVYNPSEMSGSHEELRLFAEATEKFYSFYNVADSLPRVGEEKPLSLPEPLDTIAVVPGPRTADREVFGKDGVSRRLIFSYENVLTLHPILARAYNSLTSAEEYRGIFDFMGSKQAYIDFRPPGTYQTISFIDVLQNRFDPDLLRDKIILVGRDTLELSKDYAQTPYSRSPTAMSVLELQANMFDTLILNRAVVKAPKWLDLLITAIIALLSMHVVLLMRPTQGLFTLLGSVLAFVLICWVAMAAGGLWLGMAQPLMATFFCYYFVIPYRLIMESRRSWEYYQHNKLLTQVEELKSNFMRMMSHDLKTPLARIQGMAEMVIRDSTPLSEKQRSAILSIGESSEELTEFIGSILSLSRIESKEIKLDMKSRDINLLLNDLVEKQQFMAKRKNIEILCEFEPLFSVKVDEELLRQVFSNLIENALKYSPENSKVLITTEEVEGKIIVQIADQGRGIGSADLGNIFTKFYRSPEVKNTEVSGSGLGLYLAKYFVELHQGQIDVESEVGQGSTFTVQLPMNLAKEIRSR